MELTAFIKEDLKARLVSGQDIPERFTLLSISKLYGVSLTPVRRAMDGLIAEGLFKKGGNGRLSLVPKSLARIKPAPPVDRPPSAEDWNQALMQDIMQASLGGEARYLREEALARKHGIGRSVVRQSLHRLAGAGLVEHVPRCGWLVSPLRQDKMHEYIEIRETLELKALELARPHLDPEILRRLLEDNRPKAGGARPRLNNALHQYWIDKSGNRYIQAFFEQHVANYYTMLFEHAAPKAALVAEMARQHCQILEALLAKHWTRARHALSDHIWTQERVLRMLLKK